MIEYLKGRLADCSPAHAIIDCGGVGYMLQISLHTYSRLDRKADSCLLFTHEIIREDAHELFGFADQDERWVFRKLISVSGVGANTGRMILSALNPGEVRQAIVSGNVGLMKSIKGIGTKTAERIIVDLRDKIGIESDGKQIFSVGGNTVRQDALTALSSLGFDRMKTEKTLDKILAEQGPELRVEDLVKLALKQL
jgi:Holliday junction DNA helicase RuvA